MNEDEIMHFLETYIYIYKVYIYMYIKYYFLLKKGEVLGSFCYYSVTITFCTILLLFWLS